MTCWLGAISAVNLWSASTARPQASLRFRRE